ncbi:MAG TPA: amidohydrolase family protein [Candidatus Limnocylindrales bacterium]|nr:amidohydrolase family protein [Candidatus Limnocylindrales bacterium]
MIDLQVNGAGGFDLTDSPERLWDVGAVLARFGCTAFLPTLVSPSWATVDRARAVLAAGTPDGYAGATPLGWHVEGPFLSPKRNGAHNPAMLQAPDAGAVADWSPATGVRMATLAPELPGALALVEALVGNGVVVSAGHSAATFEEARRGFDAGIRGVTHLFNAMSPLDHRDPGLPGAALSDDRVTVWLIPDGLHVHPALVSIVRRAVSAHRLAVVTDAIAALGVPPGRHSLAGRLVDCDETSARLPDGTLAGSVIGLEQAVRNLAAFTGCSIDEARLAVTTVPERVLARLDPGAA